MKNEMTPRELCGGLMRGDRVDMKRGYGPESAALVAAERNKLDEDEFRTLLAWALGFADGMQEAIHRSDPATPPPASLKTGNPATATAYREGLASGRTEDGLRLFPTPRERRAEPL